MSSSHTLVYLLVLGAGALVGLLQLGAFWGAGYFWAQGHKGRAAALMGAAVLALAVVPAISLLVAFL